MAPIPLRCSHCGKTFISDISIDAPLASLTKDFSSNDRPLALPVCSLCQRRTSADDVMLSIKLAHDIVSSAETADDIRKLISLLERLISQQASAGEALAAIQSECSVFVSLMRESLNGHGNIISIMTLIVAIATLVENAAGDLPTLLGLGNRQSRNTNQPGESQQEVWNQQEAWIQRIRLIELYLCAAPMIRNSNGVYSTTLFSCTITHERNRNEFHEMRLIFRTDKRFPTSNPRAVPIIYLKILRGEYIFHAGHILATEDIMSLPQLPGRHVANGVVREWRFPLELPNYPRTHHKEADVFLFEVYLGISDLERPYAAGMRRLLSFEIRIPHGSGRLF